MALDKDLTKACKLLEIQKVVGGKIGVCNTPCGEKYLCTGTVIEQRGDKKDIYVLYLNLGKVQECSENNGGYRG